MKVPSSAQPISASPPGHSLILTRQFPGFFTWLKAAALAIWAFALKRVGGALQCRELGSQVAALHQPGIALGHLEQGVLTLAPEADVELVSAKMQIVHGEIGQPLRQPGVDVEFVARRVG